MKKWLAVGVILASGVMVWAGSIVITKNPDGTFTKAEVVTDTEFNAETEALKTELKATEDNILEAQLKIARLELVRNDLLQLIAERESVKTQDAVIEIP